ncbi:MAG: SRPBCC family protein [Sphingobacteriales bacterium]|jgi:uncharacterized protein YndB with AHSA1/START domain|nr:MAG: SRPBCC family protein [Sphingobacteriales bacterium]
MEEQNIIIETQMMIRKPIVEVFDAFINPNITTNFWFSKSSGRLEENETIEWTWKMYNFSTKVFVKEIIANKKIVIEWENPTTTIVFEFLELSEHKTYVTIKNYGFDVDDPNLIQSIIDKTGGFTTVLDGLKAYLEHNINLNLIEDKFPSELNKH